MLHCSFFGIVLAGLRWLQTPPQPLYADSVVVQYNGNPLCAECNTCMAWISMLMEKEWSLVCREAEERTSWFFWQLWIGGPGSHLRSRSNSLYRTQRSSHFSDLLEKYVLKNVCSACDKVAPLLKKQAFEDYSDGQTLRTSLWNVGNKIVGRWCSKYDPERHLEHISTPHLEQHLRTTHMFS